MFFLGSNLDSLPPYSIFVSPMYLVSVLATRDTKSEDSDSARSSRALIKSPRRKAASTMGCGRSCMLATSSEANNTPSVSAISSISENSEPIGMYFLAASRWFFLARLPCTLPRSSLMSIIASFLARFSLTSVPSPVLPSARFSSLNCASEAALMVCCLLIFLENAAEPAFSFSYSLMWSSKCLTLVGDKFSRIQPSASLVLAPPCPL